MLLDILQQILNMRYRGLTVRYQKWRNSSKSKRTQRLVVPVTLGGRRRLHHKFKYVNYW